jgi:hypothetical protein
MIIGLPVGARRCFEPMPTIARSASALTGCRDPPRECERRRGPAGATLGRHWGLSRTSLEPGWRQIPSSLKAIIGSLWTIAPVVQEGRFLTRFQTLPDGFARALQTVVPEAVVPGCAKPRSATQATRQRALARTWPLERRESVCQPHRLTRRRFRRADRGAA